MDSEYLFFRCLCVPEPEDQSSLHCCSLLQKRSWWALVSLRPVPLERVCIILHTFSPAKEGARAAGRSLLQSASAPRGRLEVITSLEPQSSVAREDGLGQKAGPIVIRILPPGCDV